MYHFHVNATLPFFWTMTNINSADRFEKTNGSNEPEHGTLMWLLFIGMLYTVWPMVPGDIGSSPSKQEIEGCKTSWSSNDISSLISLGVRWHLQALTGSGALGWWDILDQLTWRFLRNIKWVFLFPNVDKSYYWSHLPHGYAFKNIHIIMTSSSWEVKLSEGAILHFN